MPAEGVTISALAGHRLSPQLAAQIDAIFFQASGRDGFSTREERAAFRERWLGRYLRGGTDVLLVAQDPAGTVAGYLVGALEDPAGQERFADIGYFRAEFRELCRRYPAHLHINVAAGHRGSGVGGSLIEALAAHAARRAVAGIHAVTALGVRNNGFYANCGFRLLGEAAVDGRMLAFFGRALAPP